MSTATQVGSAGLQGWRAKVGDALADPVSQRTPLSADQVRAGLGGVFFALSVLYVVKTVRAASDQLRG